jgi:ABC-type multidrug transport system permease subunit
VKNSPHALAQLLLFRMRGFLREPSALFWTFIFPMITTLVLGLAFRDRPPPELSVAVVEGPQADRLVPALEAVEGLSATRMSEDAGRDALRRGKVALVLRPGPQPELIVDPMQPEGRTARLMVVDALERLEGRQDRLTVKTQQVTAPGSRYIDFLIPGLLGLGLMSSSLWGLGWALVQMRVGKLLKRLVATPMKRSQFLLSFMISRSVLALVETLFYVVFGRLLFDVTLAGSLLAFVTMGLLGSLSFSGIAVLVTSRANNFETAGGLINLVLMPMMVICGVFFSSSNFPDWLQPFIQALPLTALNDGLRAIMLDGMPLLALWPQVLILGAWGLIPFLIAVRYFKWM